MTVSPEATAVPAPAIRVCSISCFGGWLAGKATVGFVLKAPVTVIPVFSTTGTSAEVGALPFEVELVADGWLAEPLDPADEERLLEEQALSETTPANSNESSVGPWRNRGSTKLDIDSVLSS